MCESINGTKGSAAVHEQQPRLHQRFIPTSFTTWSCVRRSTHNELLDTMKILEVRHNTMVTTILSFFFDSALQYLTDFSESNYKCGLCNSSDPPPKDPTWSRCAEGCVGWPDLHVEAVDERKENPGRDEERTIRRRWLQLLLCADDYPLPTFLVWGRGIEETTS